LGRSGPLTGVPLADRLAMLPAPATAVLEAWRDGLPGDVPHFDPLDGGTAARCLILLETPGAGMGAGDMVSRDSPTGTGRNLRRFAKSAGLAREDTVLWNAVPWVIHAPGAPNRPPRAREIREGLVTLPGLLKLLLKLRVAVLAGHTAAQAEPVIEAHRPDLAVLTMPHPSPTIVCTNPVIGQRIATALAAAARMLASAA